MTAKIQVRRDTTAQWAAGTPPTLDVGEIGLDTDLKQIKIGDNVNNWTALPWLGGTLPFFSSPAADIDASTNRVAGLYRWAGIASITSGVVPAAPIDIKAADGGINMLVLKFGTTVMQHLWTDGDGTASAPPKSYTRVWDGDVSLWRAWVPQNIWGISATEGVDIVAKSIETKATALFGGVATFSAGTAAIPAITTTGDTNTGISFPSADTVTISTAGTARLTVGSLGGVTMTSNLQVDGTLDMTSGQINNLAAPTNSADATTKSYVDGARIGQTAVIAVNGTTILPQVSGTSTSGLFTIASAGIGNLRSLVGTWQGIACSSTGNYAQLDVNTSSASTTDRGGGTTPTNIFWATLIRIS